MIRRRSFPARAALALALAIAAVAPAPAPADADPLDPADLSRPVATWDGGALTAGDLRDWLVRAHGTDVDLGEAQVEAAVRDLVFRRRLAAEAEARNLDRVGRGRWHLEAVRQSLLVPRLRQQIASRSTVSDREVEDLYRRHPDAFRKPRKLKLRNIFLRLAPEDGGRASLERLEEVRRQVAAGADFAQLARQTSESQTAPRGGSLGWVDPIELPPEVAAAVADLAPGELSRPVRHGSGVSLFLCEEVREPVVPTPDEVRTELRRRLEGQRDEQAWDAFREELLAEYPVRVARTDDGVTLKLPGARLGPAEIDALLASRGARRRSRPAPEAEDEILHDWAFGVLAAREAVARGLAGREVEAELGWRRLDILARLELARRLTVHGAEPADGELEAYLARHRARFREPASLHLAGIHLGVPDDQPAEEARAMIERGTTLARQLAAAEVELATAARRHSIHPSAARGGDLGWKSRRQIALLGPTAKGAIERLEPGGVTGLLHLDTGLWLYTLLDERPDRHPPLEEIEDAVRAAWSQDELAELEDEIRRRELERIGLEVHLADPAAAADPRVVRWTTASELENYGYHVYRGPTEDGPFERLTEEPILGAGTSDVPHSYRFEDTTAVPGEVYYYYVESISTSGQTRRFTPVQRSAGGGGAPDGPDAELSDRRGIALARCTD